MLALPHLELLGIIAGLAIASVGAWTSNTFLWRARRLERDLHETRRELQRLRHEIITLSAREPAAGPARPSLRERVETVPGEKSAIAFGREAGAVPKPDVQAIAAQLGLQSPDAIENLLSGKLSLGDAARQMGTGRQEARLLCWLHSADGRRPHA